MSGYSPDELRDRIPPWDGAHPDYERKRAAERRRENEPDDTEPEEPNGDDSTN